jgi:tetratricopeptide (TPR) repeat protein
MAKIGVGGHSEVWRARDLVRREDLALKIMKRGGAAQADAWALLQHEYAVTRELGHPGILKVYEPLDCEGLLVLPMALAPGGDLGALRGEAYTRIVPVLIEVAQALEHAHGRGVVHRDLKPGNVLLDSDGRALIADFGVASFAGGSPFADHGSPFSASPQALRGEPPTPADDIYGLGTLAYELLGGYPPFYPRFETRRVLEEPVAELKSQLAAPPRLTALVMRMLAKTREGRPDTMRAVIDELHASLHDTVTIETEVLAGQETGPAALATSNPTMPIADAPDSTETPDAPGEPRDDERTMAIELPEPLRMPQAPASGSADEIVAAPVDAAAQIGIEPAVPVAGERRYGMWAGIAALAAAIALVFFVLPRWAPQRASSPVAASAPDASPAQRDTAAPPADPAEQLATLRAGITRRLGAIETRAAAVWGGDEFAAVKQATEAAGLRADDGEIDAAIAEFTAVGKRLAHIEARAPEALAVELVRGDAALAAGDPVRARSAFALAQRIDPQNDRAAAGLARAQALEIAMPLVAQAANAASAARHAEASELYQRALAADPANERAREGLASARAALGAGEYARTLASGFSALQAGDLAGARSGFEGARAMQPGASAPQQGLEQVAAAEQARAGDEARTRAASLEASERWSEALAIYEGVLARDPALQFAQAGRERAAPRAELARRLQLIIDNPDRLATEAVRRETAQLLDVARASQPAGPVIRSQVSRIELLLPAYDQVVRVAFESDNATEVAIQRVGTFGTFLRREVELKPGRYTVTGKREGFRDIRREITIAPGAAAQTIAVSCIEPI